MAELGEFGLIRRLTENITLKNSGSLKGVGDDCAVLDYGGKRVVVTTDLLTEGIHFNLMYVPLKHLGYKAVAVNVSDLCAMNAVPPKLPFRWPYLLQKFSVGAAASCMQAYLACNRYGVDLVGGDTAARLPG